MARRPATRRSRPRRCALDHAACQILGDNGSGSSSTPSAPGTRRSTLGEEHGYRNAQATVIAPTGTIGLVMDCDTTGIEPDFALVKFKKLAGGGYFKIINRAVPEALRVLGYSEARSPRSRPTRSATARSARRPASTTPRSAPRALRRGDREGREGAADRLRHQVRVQQVDAGRGPASRPARVAGRDRSPRRPSTCSPISASPSARSRPPTSTSAAR